MDLVSLSKQNNSIGFKGSIEEKPKKEGCIPFLIDVEGNIIWKKVKQPNIIRSEIPNAQKKPNSIHGEMKNLKKPFKPLPVIEELCKNFPEPGKLSLRG